MAKAYIYGLIDPRDNKMRYVGKSKDPYQRYKAHLARIETSHKGRWISLLKRNGLKPHLIILDIVDESCWQEYEKTWVSEFRKSLTNSVDGGVGVFSPSEETRRKMSRAKIGKEPHNKGKSTPAETREKQSITAKTRFEGMSANEKKAFAEVRHANRDKDSYSHSGWHHTEDARLKIAEANKGNKKTAILSKIQVDEIVQLIEMGDLENNAIANMYGVSANTISGIKYGKLYQGWTGIKQGEKNGYEEMSRKYRKLTDEQAREIYRLSKHTTQREIARLFHVSQAIISAIVNKKKYADITRDMNNG